MGFDASPRTRHAIRRQERAESAPLRRAAMIGNFPPRLCGIATFTRDAFESLRRQSPGVQWSLVAMDDGAGHEFPAAVTHVIPQDDVEAYVRTAADLNRPGAEVVFIQHEYGIFGGEAGSHLLHLMRRLRMPAIVTLHTVLERPSPAQRRVMDEILSLAAGVITMTHTGSAILQRVHEVDPEKIHIFPHGAPERPLASPDAFKAPLGLTGRKVLLTFGLLSPNKGLETIIRGLPAVLERHPDAIYLIVGATHPHLVAREGEAYRQSLTDLAASLGVGDHLRFVNRFVGDAELIDLLQAADLYLTPYLTEAQITSGTLSYAIALGKPVISTPYWHARDALSNGVGVLCGFGDTPAFTREINTLLSDPQRREAMSRRAYQAGIPSRWRKVAAATLDLAAQCRATWKHDSAEALLQLADPEIAAVRRMFDDCGMLQHARFSVPDRRHGYCTDDNARALALLVRLMHEGRAGDDVMGLAWSAAAFLDHAWNPATGRFRNFMAFGRTWLDEGGSDDCCARALEALCLTARLAKHRGLRDWAADLARQALPHSRNWRSLRARALCIKAWIAGAGCVVTDDEARNLIESAASDLLHALETNRCGGRPWFEPCLAYDNARLPEALILAGAHLGQQPMLEAGLAALDHAMEQQTSPHDCFCPVPTSAFADTAASHAAFDQQPIEALASVDACLAAWRSGGGEDYARHAEAAFLWFGGRNDHGAALADPKDGGCHDGLTLEGCNLNQGAESILSYQLAATAMRDYFRQDPA